MSNQNSLSGQILKYAFDVHSALGPGLLESSYKECLSYELEKNGFLVEKEKAMPLYYKEVKMDTGYRVDILVENSIILEIKCVDMFNDVHIAQVITYLKLSGCKTGLLLNFKCASLRDGIKRISL